MRWWAEVPLSWRCATMIPQRLSVRWSQPLLRHNSMPAHSPCSICLPRCIALHCHAMLWSRDNIVISYGRKGWMPTWNSCKRMSMLWLSVRNRCAWISHGHFSFSIWAVARAPVYIQEASTSMAEAKQEKYQLPCCYAQQNLPCFSSYFELYGIEAVAYI
jgi:hypothetical protein